MLGYDFFLIIIFILLSFILYVLFNVFFAQYKKIKKDYISLKNISFESINILFLTLKKFYAYHIVAGLSLGALLFTTHLGGLGFILGFFIGFCLIEFILRTLEKKRLEQLCDQLVMFFELISNAMKSGQTLVQAMEDAHKMIENPLQHEMTLVLQQIKMGVATGQALENFSKKVVLDDISLAVGAMNVSIKTGANLTISLRNISDTIRQRRSISQKVNSLTAQGKAEGVFVGILPVLVAFFIYMRDPNYFDPLLDTTIGNLVILVMFLMQLIGFFIIKKITTIRV